MSAGHPWLTGWAVDDPPPVLSYTYVPWAQWRPTGGIRTHLEFRDSGLAEATGGLIGAQYVKYVGSGAEEQEDHGWHVHDLDWQLFILLEGSMKRGTDQLRTHVLEAGGTAYYPGLTWHREWDFSPDWEMIALRVPAVTKTITGRESELPARAAEMDPERTPVYTAERPEAYAAGEGVEAEFEVRDLGCSGPTEGRIGTRILRSLKEDGRIPRHRRAGSSWFVVLAGTAVLQVDDNASVELSRFDAVSLGPGMEREIDSARGGFTILEILIPAEAAVDAPNQAHAASTV